MEVSGQLHVPAALPPGKELWYPLDRRLDGPQSRSGCGGEEKNSQPRRESNPRTPIDTSYFFPSYFPDKVLHAFLLPLPFYMSGLYDSPWIYLFIIIFDEEYKL
jgi:hypothetical protein